ncbi:hypothetical protein [Vibrio phage H188]|nr:hypothetical protein [Vibrio phage H188]
MAEQIQFSIPDNDWVELVDIKDSGFIWHQGSEDSSPSSNVVFVRSDIKPTISATDTRRFQDNAVSFILESGSGDFYNGVNKVWASSVSGTQLISVTPNAGELPGGLFTGLRAMTVQNYTEANVKNGKQFGVSLEIKIPSDGTVYYSFKTPSGDDRISLKNRIITTDGGIRYTPRAGAAFSNTATVVPITNFNANSTNATGVTAFLVGTVTNEGTPFDVVRSASGTGGGNVTQGIFAGDGIERILQPDTEYLLKFENLDNQERFIIYQITWYEGELDLPIVVS